MKKNSLFSLLFCIAFFAGCASVPTQNVAPVLPFDDKSLGEFLEQKQQHIGAVMDAVEKRNQDIEKDPHWISWAYSKLGIRKLQDIPPSSYGDYAKYIDSSKSVYIFVHPSYYLFFHSNKPQVVRPPMDQKDSLVDLFLREPQIKAIKRLEQEQQRNEKNFLEYLTMDEKLVILLLPRNYRTTNSYTYMNSNDEYARYLNEIANGSPSVIYMESESASVGRLLSEDLVVLLSFLEAVGAKSVLIGGGYVGRCQKEFYNYVTKYSFGSNYFIVPEISTFSPEDITESTAGRFFENDQINLMASSEFILNKTPSNTNLQHLPPQFLNTVINVAMTKNRDSGISNNREHQQNKNVAAEPAGIKDARDSGANVAAAKSRDIGISNNKGPQPNTDVTTEPAGNKDTQEDPAEQDYCY
ncbi:MAG: hypothetical protein HZB62_13705 [Nitrospirae bacterium]|nr:hypothetical protein [Nitrospirota bacterium]